MSSRSKTLSDSNNAITSEVRNAISDATAIIVERISELHKFGDRLQLLATDVRLWSDRTKDLSESLASSMGREMTVLTDRLRDLGDAMKPAAKMIEQVPTAAAISAALEAELGPVLDRLQRIDAVANGLADDMRDLTKTTKEFQSMASSSARASGKAATEHYNKLLTRMDKVAMVGEQRHHAITAAVQAASDRTQHAIADMAEQLRSSKTALPLDIGASRRAAAEALRDVQFRVQGPLLDRATAAHRFEESRVQVDPKVEVIKMCDGILRVWIDLHLARQTGGRWYPAELADVAARAAAAAAPTLNNSSKMQQSDSTQRAMPVRRTIPAIAVPRVGNLAASSVRPAAQAAPEHGGPQKLHGHGY
jgi:hypothetical protein